MKNLLSKENLPFYATIECALCGAKVSLHTILQQYEENWISRIGAMICGYCAHQLYEEHDPVPEGVESNTCRCGVMILKNV